MGLTTSKEGIVLWRKVGSRDSFRRNYIKIQNGMAYIGRFFYLDKIGYYYSVEPKQDFSFETLFIYKEYELEIFEE